MSWKPLLLFKLMFSKEDCFLRGEYIFSLWGRLFRQMERTLLKGENIFGGLKAFWLFLHALKCLSFRCLITKGDKLEDQSNQKFIKYQNHSFKLVVVYFPYSSTTIYPKPKSVLYCTLFGKSKALSYTFIHGLLLSQLLSK